MITRSVLALLLLCFAPLLAPASPAVGPPFAGSSLGSVRTQPPIPQPANSSAPNCTDLSSPTGAVYPGCWDGLGMTQYMSQWNSTAEACNKGEIWSTCFLRLAYGSAGYDCSRLGSLNCTAPSFGGPVTDPQIFYGAYNIYAVNIYFSNWSDALYALKSQTAIAELVLALSGPSLPRLTPSSLLSAIITHYGLNAAADEALIDILPVDLTLLDTTVTFYSTQLSTLLAGLLESVMGEKGKLGFMLLAKKGQMMMANTEEDAKRLEASLAGSLVTGLETEANGG